MPSSLLGAPGRPFGSSTRQGAGQVTTGEALREKLANRKAEKAGQSIGYFDWAMKVPEAKTGPLNFDAFPFQREMYREGVDDKEMVVQKCTQIGISSWSMRWAVYHADTKGRTALYVFPKKGDMEDFTTLRIKPMIAASNYLLGRQRPDDPNNKGMIGVGLGKVVFRGSESKTGLDSVDCDVIVFDEYDTLDHANIPDAEMRVSSPLSPGLIRRIGVPSSPDWGISAKYDESDGRQWEVTCSACRHKQPLTFGDNVDLKLGIRICRRCSESIEQDIAAGEWVAQRPGEGRSRGYHVSRLVVPNADIPKLIK
ncbi:MAG: phage terminase large subunit family protein, partial [Baekduia sp.]